MVAGRDDRDAALAGQSSSHRIVRRVVVLDRAGDFEHLCGTGETHRLGICPAGLVPVRLPNRGIPELRAVPIP